MGLVRYTVTVKVVWFLIRKKRNGLGFTSVCKLNLFIYQNEMKCHDLSKG